MFNQNLFRFSFDRAKALEVLLYIASQTSDVYTILKILYFADKAHLSRYGRFINGDSYIAMRHGAVPSESYDIIKSIDGRSIFPASDVEKSSLSIEGTKLIPKRNADLTLLSKSDIQCLDKSISDHKDLSFNELHHASVDKAYESVNINDEISVLSIAETLSNASEVIHYLEEMYND